MGIFCQSLSISPTHGGPRSGPNRSLDPCPIYGVGNRRRRQSTLPKTLQLSCQGEGGGRGKIFIVLSGGYKNEFHDPPYPASMGAFERQEMLKLDQIGLAYIRTQPANLFDILKKLAWGSRSKLLIQWKGVRNGRPFAQVNIDFSRLYASWQPRHTRSLSAPVPFWRKPGCLGPETGPASFSIWLPLPRPRVHGHGFRKP